MPITVSELSEGIIEVKLSGKLHKADYDTFEPRIEELIERAGKVGFLMVMEDFHGWDLGAVWEDTLFDIRHHADIDRIAMVGDKKWEEWMAKVCRPFTSANIEYFDLAEIDAAREWIAAK